VRDIDLIQFDGSYVDPYSPPYQWELRATLGHAKSIDGIGTHFGTDGALFDCWNELSILLNQVIHLEVDLTVNRVLYEELDKAIIPAWEQYGLPEFP